MRNSIEKSDLIDSSTILYIFNCFFSSQQTQVYFFSLKFFVALTAVFGLNTSFFMKHFQALLPLNVFQRN